MRTSIYTIVMIITAILALVLAGCDNGNPGFTSEEIETSPQIQTATPEPTPHNMHMPSETPKAPDKTQPDSPIFAGLLDIFTAYARRNMSLAWDDVNDVLSKAGYEVVSLSGNESFMVFGNENDPMHAWLGFDVKVDSQTLAALVYYINDNYMSVSVSFSCCGDKYFIDDGAERYEVSDVDELICYIISNTSELADLLPLCD